MCGISGIYEFKNFSEPKEALMRRMIAALKHRGPDEEGFWSEGAVCLGHARLRVIDLSGGRQPMLSADGRYAVSFNGEIYNFLELREALEKEGRRFKTASDTESLVELFSARGISGISDLRGMFAFAAYDRIDKKIFLSVDSFGKKPLYYYHDEHVFLFASEPKAILVHPAVSKKISKEALAQYLAFEYVPAPNTIFQGIKKMEGGTWLCVDASGNSRTGRYHQFEWAQDKAKSEESWAKDFDALFLKAVERRLISDVPLGVFLSGGVDSSAVLWAVNKIHPRRKVKTFTIEFDDASFDESRYARQVSEYFGAEHITEKCTALSMLDRHESILSALDEPLADASFIPTYLLCELARKHVTVALSGDGGDEVFMGYPTFEAHALAARLDRWPGWVRRMARWGADQLPVSTQNMSFDFKAKQFFKGLEYRPFLRDQVWLGSFAPAEAANFLASDLSHYSKKITEMLYSHSMNLKADDLQKLQSFYYRFYLQSDILVKVDRASMAHSLEVRSPLLDEDLAKRMDCMPSSVKMKGGKLKFFLKKCLQGRLPENILNRPKKGFGIPVAKWISGELKEHFRKKLFSKRIAGDGLFRPDQIKRLLEEHWSGERDHRKKLWTLYMFETWKEKWL